MSEILTTRKDIEIPEFWEFLKDTSSYYTGYYDLNTLKYQLEVFSKEAMEEYAQ